MEDPRPGKVNALSDQQAWFIAMRWQQLDGEYRTNYLRIVTVCSFFAIHAVEYYAPLVRLGTTVSIDRSFHLAATVIASVWLLMALAVELSLRQRFFPVSMPYVTTAVDLILLTAVIVLGGGQQSPLVLGYPLILVFAAMRFDLVLIRFATAAAVFAYLYLLAIGRWPGGLGGRQIAVVPRYAQLMTLLAIAVTGIALGQLIRRMRTIAAYYAGRRGGEQTNGD